MNLLTGFKLKRSMTNTNRNGLVDAHVQVERLKVYWRRQFSTTPCAASWSAYLWLSLFRVLLRPLQSLCRLSELEVWIFNATINSVLSYAENIVPLLNFW